MLVEVFWVIWFAMGLATLAGHFYSSSVGLAINLVWLLFSVSSFFYELF